MTTLLSDKDLFLDHFAQFDNHWEDAPFAGLRDAARGRFHELRMPGPKSEDWRFTSIAPLRQTVFELATMIPKATPGLPESLGADAIRLVFVNGQIIKGLSTIPKIAGLVVGSLAEHPEAERHLGQILDTSELFFANLNDAVARDGLFVKVADSQTITAPIEVIFLTHAKTPSAVYPRLLVVLGKNSQATLVERHLAPSGSYYSNTVAEFSLGDDARLHHVKVQLESPDAIHLANMQAILGKGSNFASHYLSLGGSLVRHEARVRFDGQHAEATLNGLYLASGKQHIDNLTVIDHAQPNCASHELYKGILDDDSHGVFNGKIFVRKDAQKTDAKQTNKVLLLSDRATINTKPQLEIFADDVKCTHGATVGQLDDNQIYYLRSRGIGLVDARRLLTWAFANDLLGRVPVEGVRTQMEEFLVHRKFQV